MFKLFKIIVVFSISIIAIYLLACLFLPSSFIINKKIKIEATKTIVFKEISQLENWKNWNILNIYQSSNLNQSKGNNQDYINFKSSKWGSGQLKILKSKTNVDSLSFEMFSNITKSNSKIDFKWNESEKMMNCVVEGKYPFYLRVYNILMEKRTKNEIEDGLKALKNICENKNTIFEKQYYSLDIAQVELTGGNYAGIRKVLALKDINKFYNEASPKVKQASKNIGMELLEKPELHFYSLDFDTKMATVRIALKVKGDSTFKKEFSIMELKPQKALMINYKGGNYYKRNSYLAFNNYIRIHKLSKKYPEHPIIEKVIKNSITEPDSNKWNSILYYPIQ